VLNEDEEGVLHLPGRELEAADDLLQRQRTVAQKAATHFLRKRGPGVRVLGQRIRASLRERARNGGERRGRRWAYGYDGAEVVGDDVNGEEDAVLRHHGGAPAASREALGLGARCGGRRWSRRAYKPSALFRSQTRVAESAPCHPEYYSIFVFLV
jgi:hypothetical protein